MKLTRRDALKGLVLGGGVAGGSLAASEMLVEHTSQRGHNTLAEHDIETLLSVAEVVYPSEVEVTYEFVAAYAGRLDDDRTEALTGTIGQLDDVAMSTYGSSFAGIESRSRREALLRTMGVHRVPSSPDGTVPERVRYHLVNSLLYVLFTSPRGSKLVGIDSPAGHPGGFAHYRDTDT